MAARSWFEASTSVVRDQCVVSVSDLYRRHIEVLSAARRMYRAGTERVRTKYGAGIRQVTRATPKGAENTSDLGQFAFRRARTRKRTARLRRGALSVSLVPLALGPGRRSEFFDPKARAKPVPVLESSERKVRTPQGRMLRQPQGERRRRVSRRGDG